MKKSASKKKIKPRIFIKVAILILITFGVYKIIIMGTEKRVTAGREVYFPLGKGGLTRKTDPAKIIVTDDYVKVDTLYGKLINFSDSGKVLPELAESYRWVDGNLIFKLKPNLKTSKGESLGPEDVVMSFKRLLLLDTNSHGNLRVFLDVPSNKKGNLSKFDGIRKGSNNEVVFNLKEEYKVKFFIKLLGSADFSIIPRSSVNWKSPELEIEDYSNTTGAYFLKQDSRDLLLANPNFVFHNSKNPDSIKYVELDSLTAEEFVNNNSNVFMHGLIVNPAIEVWKRFAKDTIKYKVLKTEPICIFKLTFTEKGKKGLTQEQRRYLGRLFRERLKHLADDGFSQITNQYFPVVGDGSLSKEEVSKINTLEEKTWSSPPKFPEKLKIFAGPLFLKEYAPLFKDVEFLEFEKGHFGTVPKSIGDQPEAVLGFIDSAFFEDFSLISYNISVGTFAGLDKVSGKKWLDDYMKTPEREDRLKKLRKLHFDTLVEANVVPIFIEPFPVLLPANFDYSLNKFFSWTPIHHLTSK